MYEKKTAGLLFRLLEWITSWADPWYWVVLSIVILAIAVLHPVPLTLKAENSSTSDHVAMFIRKWSLGIFLGIGIVLPLVTYMLFGALAGGNPRESSPLFKAWAIDMLQAYFGLPLAALLGGLSGRFIWDRYGMPWWSNLVRKYRVKQHEDKPVDARDIAGQLEPKSFDPETYFKPGHIFYGLTEHNQPVYTDWDTFREIHNAIIGPTRYGKGVVLGGLYTQVIRFGCSAFYIDPKGDANLPYILQNEAKRAGRPFVYLDLNPTGKGNWHPFKGGSPRSRRARIIQAFGLGSGGTDADVYKSNERALLDQALAKTDGSIRELFNFVKKATEKDGLSTLRDTLAEWANISTFMLPGKKRGHSIEESLRNGAVVYVKGSINDQVVKLATRVYIAELCAEIVRLDPERKDHVTVGIDEMKFLASDEVATALATIAGARCNLLLCAQSLANLESPDDKSIRGDSLVSEFVVNTQAKLLYKAADFETAEWAEKNSGTQWLKTSRMEKVETNKHGGEQWGNSRTLESTEHAVISTNLMLNLPRMVAAAYLPKMLPTVLYTCWVKVDKSFASWETPPKPDSEADQDESPEPGQISAQTAQTPQATKPTPSKPKPKKPPTEVKPDIATEPEPDLSGIEIAEESDELLDPQPPRSFADD